MAHKNPTREQLYEEVWTQPMVLVAKEYGLSDRGLAKLCTRNEIPVPPRGYWAKKAHGHKVTQSPLRPPTDARLEHIEIGPAQPKPPAQPTNEVPEIAFELQPENRIVVAVEVARYHAFVRQTRAALKGQKPVDRGLLFPRGRALEVQVSPGQVRRALRLMDTLLRAFEARGYEPTLSREPPGLTVTVLGERFSVSLQEKTKQVKRPPTKWEQWSLDNGHRHADPYDLVPSGVLTLRARDQWWTRAELTDGKAKLEEGLNKFIVRLIQAALRERQQREERAREEAKRQEAERRRREQERIREEGQKRERQWDEWMAAWTKSQQIRAFAAEVERAHAPIEPDSRIAEWLRFAGDYADRQDPLRDSKNRRSSSPEAQT